MAFRKEMVPLYVCICIYIYIYMPYAGVLTIRGGGGCIIRVLRAERACVDLTKPIQDWDYSGLQERKR